MKHCILYIVRHAQSEANAAEILGGNYPLTNLGEEQAVRLAEKLREVQFSSVYSSDMIRARRTAEIINLEHKLNINTTELLRERNFGKLDGRLLAEITTEFEDWVNALEKMSKEERFNHVDKNGIESDSSVLGRYFNFLREASLANLGKNLLIISHSSVMRSLLVHLGYATYKELPRGSIENTGYMKLRCDGVEFFLEEVSGIKKIGVY